MYDFKDIRFVGRHDFDDDKSLLIANSKWSKTFSIGIFRWELKGHGRSMKKGKVVVRVKAPCWPSLKMEQVFETAKKIVSELDEGRYTGSKNVVIK